MGSLLKSLILPSNIVLLMFAAGALLILLRARRAGAGLLAGSICLYLVFSFGPVSCLMLGALEYRHPPLSAGGTVGARKIVVLTGDGQRDARIPLSSRVNGSSAFRLIEAARIFRENRGMDIIITGYGDVPALMKEVLAALGLPGERIAVEDESLNTFESARNVSALVGKEPFILVTSAGHMPRSVKVFSGLGMAPVPAPTDYLVHGDCGEASYLPAPRHLWCSDLAVHEYAAMAYYRLRGRL